jgi:hypothetical protein
MCSAPEVPEGYRAQFLPGFVEELVVNDDPEYKWIDKIRDKPKPITYQLGVIEKKRSRETTALVLHSVFSRGAHIHNCATGDGILERHFSGHKLESSVSGFFVWFSTLICPFYKVLFMKRLEFSCFGYIFKGILKTREEDSFL